SRRRHDERSVKQKPHNYDFILRVTPSKRAVTPLPEGQVIYLLVEILPDPRVREHQEDLKREARLNLTLVLDRSNSMNGARLERVKVAAHQIIDQLNTDDIFSVVTFNDFADVLIPATAVEDKASLKARVSLMSAAGGTEIFKGLSSGIEQN